MTSKKLLMPLSIGILVGFGLASLLFNSMMTISSDLLPHQRLKSFRDQVQVDTDLTQNDQKDDQVAQKLFDEVKILCWVMTGPDPKHAEKCRTIKETWGSRCNKLIFVSSKADTALGTIALPNVTEGRDWLWAKTKAALKHIWTNHKDDAHWFLKADDDTFVILENLRYFLSDKRPTDPVYYGCRFRPNSLPNPNYTGPQGYMSGGAGYVMSKETVRKFVEEALQLNGSLCSKAHKGAEDTEIGRCLSMVGVKAGDSLDEFGRNRFFPLSPEDHLTHRVPGWMTNYTFYAMEKGNNCCSSTSISFHYVKPNQMRLLYHMLYFMGPYGINRHYEWPIPKKKEEGSLNFTNVS